MSPRLLALSVGACFFLSGAAGLVYEVAWVRVLGLFLGHTTNATTVVLAAFMAGLALGAILFGRIIDRRGRPLLVYALLEAGIGLYALALPSLLARAEPLLVRLQNPASAAPAAGVLAILFLLLLVPTTLMGGTLPVLSRLRVREVHGAAGKIGDLYALNTVGAVAGVVAAGFVLLPAIGVRATVALAAAVNALVAGTAIALDRAAGEEAATPRGEDRLTARAAARPLRLAAAVAALGLALSGAASMVYEIAWTRALAMVVGSSTYAFSTMLATFLVGLALGSFLFARLRGGREAGLAFFAGLEVAIGFSTLLLIPAFSALPELCLRLFQRFPPSHASALAVEFLLSFLVMIVPTVLIGAMFPCAVQACVRRLGDLGRDVGRLYAANTVGAIGGVAAAGLLLVPLLGVRGSIVLASGVNVLVGTAVLAFARWSLRPLILPVPFALALALLPGWNPAVMASGIPVYVQRFLRTGSPVNHLFAEIASKQVLYYRDGVNATVSVERTDTMTTLKVNGKADASNGIDMLTQLMLGHLPAFLHAGPQRALVIGLGSGVTVAAMSRHPIAEIDVVELEPAVVEASSFFSRENRSVLRDPRVRVTIADGRAFLRASPRRYDVISSEPSNPWMAGVANLFSLEFYRLCRERLAPGGVMAQWIHGYSLFPDDLRMVVATFRQVFPHATLWRTHRGDYILIAMDRPLEIDYRVLRARYDASPAIGEDLAVIGWDSPLALLTLFLLDEEGVARFAGDAPWNSDDLPILEFSAPLALYASTIDANDGALRTARAGRGPRLVHADEELLHSPATRLRIARAFWVWGEREEALRELRDLPPLPAGEVPLHVDKARLFFALGEVERAVRNLHEECSEAAHPLVASYLRAGEILGRFDFGSAVAEHGKPLSGSFDPAEALNNLGVFYNALGIRFREGALFDLAVDAFQAALAVSPASYSLLNNLGSAYFEKGMWKEAREAYGRAIGARPDLADAFFNRGLAHQSEGKVDLAKSDYQRALTARPGWNLPRANLLRLNAKAALPTHSAAQPVRSER